MSASFCHPRENKLLDTFSLRMKLQAGQSDTYYIRYAMEDLYLIKIVAASHRKLLRSKNETRKNSLDVKPLNHSFFLSALWMAKFLNAFYAFYYF